MARKNSTETRTRSLVIRWGTSRGAETYGYTTCTARIDGKRLGSCSGGGYDLEGSAIAEAITKEYGNRLWALHTRAASAGVQIDGAGYQRIERPSTPARLYGLSATYTNSDHTKGRIHMDGACGLSSVEAIMKAIGLKLRRVHSDSRVTVYELIDVAA